MNVAMRKENEEVSWWTAIRRGAEALYPIVYGPDDYATAKQKAETDQQKQQLEAQVMALHRRLEREQEIVDRNHMSALDDLYNGAAALKDGSQHEYARDPLHQGLDEIHSYYRVIPQGYHPQVMEEWGIRLSKPRLNKRGKCKKRN